MGVEPSETMAAIADSREVTVHRANAEDLPFESEYFDFALMTAPDPILDGYGKGAFVVIHSIKNSKETQ